MSEQIVTAQFIGAAEAYMPAVIDRMREGVSFDDAVAEFGLIEGEHWREEQQ